MKLFGLTITKTSHYDNLVKEVTTLAISNVNLIKENAKYELECNHFVNGANYSDNIKQQIEYIKLLSENISSAFQIEFLKLELSSIKRINKELQNELCKNDESRKDKKNMKNKCVRVQKCRRK